MSDEAVHQVTVLRARAVTRKWALVREFLLALPDSSGNIAELDKAIERLGEHVWTAEGDVVVLPQMHGG
jgi:hypothetical protein